MEHNITNPTIARLKLLYIFIVTILCMKEAYRTGGVVFSSWICSVGVMLMILLACSFLGIVSDFKKCIMKKYHQIISAFLTTFGFVAVLALLCFIAKGKTLNSLVLDIFRAMLHTLRF